MNEADTPNRSARSNSNASNSDRIPACPKHRLILAGVAQWQAEHDRAAHQFAMQQRARHQQGAHEFVGAKLPPIDSTASAHGLRQMLFVRRHHGEGLLAGPP